MNKLRAQAELLRGQGYSYRLINEKLGVSPSTLSYWFKETPFTPNQEVLNRIKHGSAKQGVRRHNERVQEIALLRARGAEELGKLSERDLLLLGIGLYIGEGSKTTESIRIVNSNPDVIRLAIRWLKDTCGLSEANLTVSLHIYPDNDPEECKDYWQAVTMLPRENFRWISVDQRLNKRKEARGKLLYGTAHITVRSNGDPERGVRLFRRINGWMARALNQV